MSDVASSAARRPIGSLVGIGRSIPPGSACLFPRGRTSDQAEQTGRRRATETLPVRHGTSGHGAGEGAGAVGAGSSGNAALGGACEGAADGPGGGTPGEGARGGAAGCTGAAGCAGAGGAAVAGGMGTPGGAGCAGAGGTAVAGGMGTPGAAGYPAGGRSANLGFNVNSILWTAGSHPFSRVTITLLVSVIRSGWLAVIVYSPSFRGTW